MKNFILTLCVLCITSFVHSQPTVNPAYTPVLTTEFSNCNFSFINNLTGFLIDNRPYTPSNYNYRKTTDGGATWSNVLMTGNKGQIYFLNQLTGFSAGTLSKTTNGGDNWTSMGVTTEARQISFINDSVGFFLNSGGLTSGNSTNQIYRTTNGGNNWSVILQGYHPNTIQFTKIEFINANTGFAMGSAQHYYLDPKSMWRLVYDSVEVLKTTNGGANWIKKFVPQTYISGYAARLELIKFFDENSGYLLTISSGHNYILKTTNGGTNWFLKKDMPYTYFSDWKFLDSNRVFSYSPYYIIKSTDAFTNYTKENIYDTTDAYRSTVMFPNGTIYIYSSKWKRLYKTSFGVPTNTGEPGTNIPAEFSISQNYPNPFNPSTKINFDLPLNSRVQIKIFDMTGKEIVQLMNEEQNAGSHSINFDASLLPSGIYFYRIITDGKDKNFVKTMKMILVK